jgi:hypothetical protein
MPVQPMNFAMIPPQGNPAMARLPQTIMQGMQLGAMPSQMQQQKQMSALQQELERQQIARSQQQQQQAAQMNPLQLQQAQLANQMMQQRMGQAQQMSPLQVQQQRLANALTQQKIAQMQQDPLGSMHLVGPAGQAASLKQLKDKFGADSEVYQDAKSLDDLQRKAKQSSMDYQTKLADSMKTRYLTQTGKGIQEQRRVAAGLAPTGEPFSDAAQAGDITPQRANALSQIYEQERRKRITDPQARQKTLLATNIRKTLDSIDPDALAKFSGTAGTIDKFTGDILAPVEGESKNYDEYQKNKQSVDMLSTQVRQFYGDSIQPQVKQQLDRLLNPATWRTNPKLAKQMYNQVKDILSKELETYEQATTIPSVNGRSQQFGSNADPWGIR